ncbi:efflux RND transporter permease subunit [Curtobacterium flaccumfaciens]|uniref:efflux RND transporter permease subunit n=1 Tax=Curtobacterium flaccumfaciens TaxID=2035 RepID=UPI00220BE76C|nr:efflux RND transporter permease subunit [Curtobacterium flaccumfaciens]MCS0471672.1 efflux RND transporter permease subunit [Curtobacterium flaccumfaciens pv. betae]MCS0473427.1 efflux RND transporter permease subunit [Curtobacterium flaccumfaciens pv. betae]MCS0477884.1 efflux RND transporter permease subunit [Curtobacterium flaccumfaciens pv. betae]MCS0479811.1 efflux RND transporter permease subunit [Curtobacterium flaccumfaciens pv. betae]MCS0485171.1 efflux RND transporter permease sub
MHLLSVFSLRNRALIALVTIVVAVFGGIALSSLKQELIPSVEFPQVAIVSAYPGATPEVVSNDVSTKIEQAIQVVPDLESTSATSSTGQSVVSASFQYGSNLASAEDKIQTAVNALSLPDSVQTQIVTGSFDDLPVLQIAVSASGNQEQLVDRLQASAIPDLEKLDGVRQADVFGNPGRRVVITPNQDELAARGLTQTAISDALDDNGTLIPGGTITEDGSTLSVQTGERIASLDDIRALPLTSSSSSSSSSGSSGSDGSGSGAAGAAGTTSPGDGTAAGATGTGATGTGATGDTATGGSTTAATPTDTTLGDVAKVAITESPRTSISRVDGQQALTISITKTQEANTVDVSETVRDALPGIEDKIEGDPRFTVVFDQAPYIQQSIDSLAEEGLLGLAFAVIVILVFLLSWRSTLVTAISIPTSVLLAAIGMRAAGYTLNIITLAALTIAIGRVVDDSIVVIENIKRHMLPGVDRGRAVRDAVREVAGAVTASTLTTVAVFLPVAFVAELVGELFRPFAVTVTLALVASLFVSLTIVPVLAYWWLRTPKAKPGDATTAADAEAVAAPSGADVEHDRSEGALASAADLHDAGTADRLRRVYLPVLRWVVRKPVVVILLAVIVLGGTVATLPFVTTNYLGDSGQNTFTVTQDLKAGSSLAVQSESARKVERALQDVDGVETVQTTIGTSGQSIQAAFGGGGSASVQYAVTTDAEADQPTIQADARKAIGGIDNVGEVTIASSGGGFGGSSDIEVDVTAPTQAQLETASRQVLKTMQSVPDTTGATSNLSAAEPFLAVRVDRQKAASLGLTETQVGGLVAAAVSPRDTGSIEIDDATLDVYIADPEPPTTIGALRALDVPTSTGTVPLSDVATVEESEGPTTVTTTNAARTATITVTPDATNLGAAVQSVTTAVDELDLPKGATASIGGVAASQSSAFSQLGLAVLVAVLIVYVIMVATFRSLLQPLLLLVSVPFAATGAILLQIASGVPIGVASLIGLLMLVGIVVTNAIVLIDLVNQYRRRGLRVREALIEGATRRLRPILMTAMATIFALLPMAIGLTGKSGFISQPLALVVIGGLVSSTLLTLVVLPALYFVVERARERRADRRAARQTEPGEAV